MKLEIHIHHHAHEGEETLRLVKRIDKRLTAAMTDLTRITAEVAENTSAIQSAILLIEGLAQQIRDNATDPAALNALADSLDASGNELAAAVAANTPGAEEPPTDPQP